MYLGLGLCSSPPRVISGPPLIETLHTATPQTAISEPGLGQDWANPTNVFTNNNQYASLNPFDGISSDQLRVTNLDYTGLDSTDPLVDHSTFGICVGISVRRHNAATGWNGNEKVTDGFIALLKNGSRVGANKKLFTVWPNLEAQVSYTWTKAEMNALGLFTIGDLGTDFGFTMTAAPDFKNSGFPECFVDEIVIQIAVNT